MALIVVAPILLIGIMLLVLAGVASVRSRGQAKYDGNRKSFKITFPDEVPEQQVLAFMHAISGSLRARWERVRGAPYATIETWFDDNGITHRFSAHWEDADYVVAQLRTHLHGIHVEEDPGRPHVEWDYAVELAESNMRLPLDIPSIKARSDTILGTFQQVRGGESVVSQWVIAPVRNRKMPEEPITRTGPNAPFFNGFVKPDSKYEVREMQAKVGEPNMRVVPRIAAHASTESRAKSLVHMLSTAICGPRSISGNHLKERRLVGWLAMDKIIERIKQGSANLQPTAILSLSELTALIAWPIDRPNVAGLPQARIRHLPTPHSVPVDGRKFGLSTYPGNKRPISVSVENSLLHTHIVGSTGCLHPDTLIYDPVAETTKTVFERYREGRPFHVFALDGDRLVVARTESPLEYRRVDMYELYNGEHSITVTGQHRVWNGHAYVEVQQLFSRSGSSAFPLPSISGNDLSRLHADAQRSMQIAEDFLDDCRQSHRSCDLPPRQAPGNDLACAPSPSDVHAPYSGDCGKDGLAHKRVCSRLGLRCGPFSRSSFQILDAPARGVQYSQYVGTYSLSCDSRPSAGTPDESSSAHHGTTVCTGQSAAASIEVPCEEEQCPHDQCGYAPSSNVRPQHVGSRSLCGHCEPALEFDQSCPEIKPRLPLLFTSYFRNNIFRVRQASAETYYDFHVPTYENYLACGLIHHNTGKTNLLTNLAVQDMNQGSGVLLIDGKGDQRDGLFHEVVKRVPRHRFKDVVILDVADTEYPVGFNILQGNPQTVASNIQSLFEHLYPRDTGSVRVPQGLYHAIVTLMTSTNATSRMTFADIGPLCSPRSDQVAFSDHIIRGVAHDEELSAFWQDVTNLSKVQRDSQFGPILNRIWQLNSRPQIRNIIGQSNSTIDIRDVIRSKKILLVNTAGHGDDVGKLMASLVTQAIWNEVQNGAANQYDPTFFYMDEFQDFLNSSTKPEPMLAKARGMGLAMIMAHQYMHQLQRNNRELHDAVLANAQNTIVFKVGPDDSQEMSRVFGGKLTAYEFANIPKHEFVARIATDAGTAGPLTGKTEKAPSEKAGTDSAARSFSRRAYGRAKTQVEAEIKARRQVPEAPQGGRGKGGKRRPRMGG